MRQNFCISQDGKGFTAITKAPMKLSNLNHEGLFVAHAAVHRALGGSGCGS